MLVLTQGTGCCRRQRSSTLWEGGTTFGSCASFCCLNVILELQQDFKAPAWIKFMVQGVRFDCSPPMQGSTHQAYFSAELQSQPWLGRDVFWEVGKNTV